MTLKPTQGTFDRVFVEEHCDDLSIYPHTYTSVTSKRPQSARIYAEYFAVFREGTNRYYSWQLYHVPTGCVLGTGDKLKDCVAKIEALLKIPLPWGESDREKWGLLNDGNPELYQVFRDALKAEAPYAARSKPKPKKPAAYGTLASAMENLNSYCPYAQAYRSLWEQDHFHTPTKKMIEDRIRFEIADELIDAHPSAQEAYDEIMNYRSYGVRCLKMGTPLNHRACKAIMRWAKTQGMLDVKAQGSMISTMSEVFEAIERECNFQEDQWGSVEETPHTLQEWCEIISEELMEAWTGASVLPKARQELLQAAAVIVACLQQHGIEERKELRPKASSNTT